MLSYNSLTYVQDMKIGHYSEFPLVSSTWRHVYYIHPWATAVETGHGHGHMCYPTPPSLRIEALPHKFES